MSERALNFEVRNADGEVVAQFKRYNDAQAWANDQGPGHPIATVDQ